LFSAEKSTSFAIPLARFSRLDDSLAMISARLRSTPFAGTELPACIARPVLPLPAVRFFCFPFTFRRRGRNNLSACFLPCGPILADLPPTTLILRRMQKMDRPRDAGDRPVRGQGCRGQRSRDRPHAGFRVVRLPGGHDAARWAKSISAPRSEARKVTRKGKGKVPYRRGRIETPITTLDLTRFDNAFRQ